MQFKFARTEEEIRKCFPVMKQLRTHITNEDEFCDRIRKQNEEGYELVYLIHEGEIHSVAGFRFGEYLAWGKIMYIDDLVTLDSSRSKNFGKELFKWLADYALLNKCDQLHLDSGVLRFAAHRFYLNQKMDITSHHFAMKLKE